MEAMGITINCEKSTLIPTKMITYLGFKLSTEDHTIKLLLGTHDRLTFLLRLVREGTDKGRERIHGFANWIVYNLRLPMFLTRDILEGDPTWLQAALRDLDVLRPRPIMDALISVNLYTDATPHSTAAIIPFMDIAHARIFNKEEEINYAEMMAAIDGLYWASSELRDTHIVLYTDNATVFSTLRSGKGFLFRRHLLRRYYLSMLHALNDNTFEVRAVAGVDNPADLPSREVLRYLHQVRDADIRGQPDEKGFYATQQIHIRANR